MGQRRTLSEIALCGLLAGCSGSPASPGSPGPSADAGADGGGSGTDAIGLAGTWDLMTTPVSGLSATTTVTIGQDAISVTSPSFSLTATRTGDVLGFVDQQTPGNHDHDIALNATRTAAAFRAGVLPFDLGGSWMIEILPQGQSAVMTCTLSVGSTEIDGSCQRVSAGFDFHFSTTKLAAAASSFGDLGGTWTNVWTYPGPSGGTYPCELDFIGNGVTTCPGGAVNGEVTGSPLTGITFTYDGANTMSGSAQGWTEFSATRR